MTAPLCVLRHFKMRHFLIKYLLLLQFTLRLTIKHFLQASQISKLQKELAALHSQDPKKAAAVLGTKFVPGETGEVDTETGDSSTQNEVVRQKDYLEKTVLSLKSQLSQVEQQNKSNNLKMFRENKELLREIARLKKEILDLKQFRVKLI